MDKKTTKNEETKNPTFHEKLVTSVNTFAGFKKDSKNPFFKSNYMSLDLICAVITPVLSENGLYATSYIEGENLVTKVTDGTDSIFSTWKLSNSVKPQERGAEMTYARRYNLSALLNISVDLDTDGNDIGGKIEVTDEIVRTPIAQPIEVDDIQNTPQVSDEAMALDEWVTKLNTAMALDEWVTKLNTAKSREELVKIYSEIPGSLKPKLQDTMKILGEKYPKS